MRIDLVPAINADMASFSRRMQAYRDLLQIELNKVDTIINATSTLSDSAPALSDDPLPCEVEPIPSFLTQRAPAPVAAPPVYSAAPSPAESPRSAFAPKPRRPMPPVTEEQVEDLEAVLTTATS